MTYPILTMKEMATSFSFGPTRVIHCSSTTTTRSCLPITRRSSTTKLINNEKKQSWWGLGLSLGRNRIPTDTTVVVLAGSKADDSLPPYEMSLESALKLLGVSEGASFDDILRAKNSIIDSCRDDQDAISRVEAAYDILLMQSLTQRRAGKVVSSNIRYADVKPVNSQGMGSMPQWMQATVKNVPISIEAPPATDLGIQAGVYGALMALSYASGASTSSGGPYAGADVPGLILAASFGASLYFLTKKNIKLGKSTVITIGGLVVGAVVGSAVENWLQVDIVPFYVLPYYLYRAQDNGLCPILGYQHLFLVAQDPSPFIFSHPYGGTTQAKERAMTEGTLYEAATAALHQSTVNPHCGVSTILQDRCTGHNPFCKSADALGILLHFKLDQYSEGKSPYVQQQEQGQVGLQR